MEQYSKQTITDSTCIITGGAGFIGSHLVDALSTQSLQNQVVIVDNLRTGKLENISHHFKDVEAFQNISNKKNIDRAYAKQDDGDEEQKTKISLEDMIVEGDHVTFIKADITHLALLQNIFQKYKPAYVFHLAAVASVPQSIQDPLTTHHVNVTGTLNTLLAAKEVGTVKKYVFSSSCAVYGNPKEDALPIKETQPPNPLSPYATSKLMGEQYCSIFNKTYMMPTVILRYFNVYGPRQDPHGEYAAVIPKFIERAKQGEPLIVYGDGSQTRDFIYVKDVVSSNIALAADEEIQGVFNVGSGEETSISFLANTLLSLYGSDLEHIEYTQERFGDIKHSFADTTRLEEYLQRCGVEIPFDLADGLIETVDIF